MEKLLKDLNARRDRARILMLGCLILYVFALILLFKGNLTASAIAAVLGVAVYLFAAKREKKRYENGVAEANVRHGVAAVLDGAEYAARSKMFPKDSMPMRISPAEAEKMTDPLCCHAVTGTHSGRRVELCEMTFGYQYGEKKSAWRFFPGTAARLEIAPRAGSEALMISPNLFDGSFTPDEYEQKGWRKAVCPGWSAAQDGSVFVRGESEIPPEQLKALADDYRAVRGKNGRCALYVGERTVESFQRGRFYAESGKVVQKTEENAILHNGFDARDTLLALADRLSDGETA